MGEKGRDQRGAQRTWQLWPRRPRIGRQTRHASGSRESWWESWPRPWTRPRARATAAARKARALHPLQKEETQQ